MPKKNVDDESKSVLGGLIRQGRPPGERQFGVMSTGIHDLDVLFTDTRGQAIGGIPLGTHWMFAGKPKIGKSLQRIHMMAMAQRQGLKVGLVASERDVTTTGAEAMRPLGVDPDTVVYIGERDDHKQPYVIEDTLAAVAYAAHEHLVDVVFIDSTDYLVPRSVATALEIGGLDADGLLDDKRMAAVSQVFGNWLPGVCGTCSDHGVSLLLISHYHEKPGTLAHHDPRYIKGGYVLKHSVSSIFWVNRRAKSELRKAEREVEDHWFYKLVLSESRLSPKVGEEIRVALPLTTPLWESPLYAEAADAE